VKWGVFLLVLGAAAGVRADEYQHQVEMTVILLEATTDGFAKACLRLDGKLTEGEEIAKCERGRSLLAIRHSDDVVKWAMIAYPSTPENIEGLWQQAQKTFGKPDVVTEKELVWHLASGVTASAGFDQEYSTFALARPAKR
jgi:hypothetical protein